MKTKQVWIEADPETGIGIVKYMPSMRSYPTLFQRAAVPVDLIKRYEKANRELGEVKAALYGYFAAAKDSVQQRSDSSP